MRAIYHIWLAIAMSLFTVSEGISQEIEPTIVGEWQMDYTSSYNEISFEGKERINRLPEKMKERIESSYKSRLLILEDTGVFHIKSDKLKDFSGTWQYIANSQVLQLTSATGKSHQEFKVIELGSNRMVLKLLGKGDSTALFVTQYFNKN
ncbi:lipocalin family protein [Aestuariibaculum sp. M13]|uniref:lipocalin family protein n=1 Tax=unclassified Aestuariibaculum TaxID=2646735 RepID=UPI002159D259|nr:MULTISPECIES: lipocalin family protein [unclassified Aestuariibaculum]MCR8667519.1 lipocalin family protein [Aestuariibaculum sp. M13]WMI65245.1 lipocalin family protein [Aestuariibaculum sp. YM273]